MNEKEQIRLDDILQQAQKHPPKKEKPKVSDDDVNAILAGLGMGNAPTRPARPKPVAAEAEPAKPAAKQAPTKKAVQPEPEHMPPPRAHSTARIITAPVTSPVVEHESSTLELPSIKSFTEAQGRRRAAVERAATEDALRRAADKQKRNPYAMPGMTLHAENLGVEVDDRFRAFFQKSAAEETAEKEEIAPKPKPKARKKKSRAKEPLPPMSFTEEFGPVDTDGAAMLAEIQAQTAKNTGQIAAASPIAWQSVDRPGQQMPPRKAVPVVEKQPLFAQPAKAVPSDTFQMNRFESTVQQPTPIAWNTVDLPELDLGEDEQDIGYGSQPQEAYEASTAQQGQAKPKYKKIFVDIPTGNMDALESVTQETGELIPLYEVGAEDESLYDEDYNHLSDAPGVQAALKNMCITRILRICITALLSGGLLYLNFCAQLEVALPFAFLDPTQKPAVFLAVNLLLLVITGASCLTTISVGFAGLVGRPTVDTLPALAYVFSAVQLIAYLVKPEAYAPTTVVLTASLAALLLFFNAVGRWLHSVIVSKNFQQASASHQHAAASLVENRDLTRTVCRGLSESEPLLLVSRPTELVRGFMRQSFSVHSSDIASRKLSLLLLLGSILCGVLGGVVTKDVFAGISGAVATMCLAAPFASTLSYATIALRLRKEAAKVGAVVPGPSAVHNLGLCNTVLLNAKDLFPSTSVQFHGLQTFEKQRVDLAILYTTSILYEKCETLRDVFMGLIDNKKEILYKVDSPQSETGYGYSGWVENHEVLVGGREMMRRHSINVPSRDYETKYTRNGQRSIIYLSVAGKLFGMFVISYQPNAGAQAMLNRLEAEGVGVLLQSDDFNVNQALLAAIYRVSPSFVKVLSQPESAMLSAQTQYMPESDGFMTHTGNCTSFVGGLKAAAHAAAGEKLAGMVQMGALLFTLVLCLILSFTLGVENLSLLAMILYQLAWCAVTVIVPLVRRR